MGGDKPKVQNRLSAEPLVGLKHVATRGYWYWGGSFSRTPRGFEAASCKVGTSTHRLSAEPLVGLKLPLTKLTHLRRGLSAEPLVGLKRQTQHNQYDRKTTFSRTPRGFEA